MQELDRRTLLQTGVMGVTAGIGLSGIAGRGQATGTSPDKAPAYTTETSAISLPDPVTEPLWTKQFDGDTYARYAYGGEAVYVRVSPQNDIDSTQLLAINAETGEVRWQRDFSSEFIDIRPFEDNVLVQQGSTITAYDPPSGSQQWTIEYPSEGEHRRLTTSLVREKTFLVTSEEEGITDNQLLGVDQSTGEIIWNKTISLPGAHQEATLPFSPNEYVMFATADGHRILDLDARTGEVFGTYTIPVAEPIASSDSLIVSLREYPENYTLVNSSSYTGSSSTEVVRVFESFDSDPVLTLSGPRIPQIDGRRGDLKYGIIDEGQFRAVAVPSGETLWTQSIDTDINHQIGGWVNGLFYHLTNTPASAGYTAKLAARQISTGQVEWSRTIYENMQTEDSRPPYINLRSYSDPVIVGRANGDFLALDAATGTVEEWAISLTTEGDNYDLYRANQDGFVMTTTDTYAPESTSLSMFPAPDSDSSSDSPSDGSDSPTESPSEGNLSLSLSPSSVTSGTTTDVGVTVTDSATGDAVVDATVSLSALGLSATTDLNGEATLSINTNDPDEYTISVSKDGYADTTTTLTVEDSESSDASFQDVLGTIGDYNSGNASFQDVLQAIADYNANN
ncbi:outer membrane protein assembly factor BamB family protein [Haloplanus rubicundus]|uniref:Pyrrolo-quinoline quinone repeat domain-containing protein n=1 Tax=Haloplanus rubicundus TaxID=1547898 RepID=A0A345EF87_9EURY|nr:PQQ-binding-like beta-propeller repeat protein [Haloplanus rubicundus]AXG10859.1 hypothetical protein DU484_13955 [Haloplanus rubicundus]